MMLGGTASRDAGPVSTAPESVTAVVGFGGVLSGACILRGNSVAAMVAATSTSRLWRPSSGLPYLEAITSPCSVMRIRPCTAPAGWARMAW